MQNRLVALNNVSLKFSYTEVLSNINLKINAGEHRAIIGKSGSGKTMLLQVLAGNIRVNSGQVDYHFTDLANANEEQSYDFQQFIAFAANKHHFRNLSNTNDLYYQQRYNSSDSEDALTVNQYLHQIKPNKHKIPYWTVSKTLKALNLDSLADKAVIKLSNGETRRLMIAAALLKNPVVLLLDNPMTGLDVQTRKYLNALLDEIASSGITMIMVTSPVEIPAIVKKITVMDGGRISADIEADKFVATDSFNEQISIDYKAIMALTHTNSKHQYKHIVNMQHVNISYGDKRILSDINWQVLPGERWALLGANGAGKSTLLSLINGDNPQAYANNIILFDRKRGTGESIWDIKSKIGFVSPELYQYFPADNSCLQVVESGFYDTLGLFRPSIQSRADLALKWMKALEIEKYSRTLLKNIPASAQRLFLLARALIKNPDLLIFDEPCQGLDHHQQQHFKTVIDTICANSHASMIYVTHYQHEIPSCVHKVLKLDKGIAI